jgi:hypothetical protein
MQGMAKKNPDNQQHPVTKQSLKTVPITEEEPDEEPTTTTTRSAHPDSSTTPLQEAEFKRNRPEASFSWFKNTEASTRVRYDFDGGSRAWRRIIQSDFFLKPQRLKTRFNEGSSSELALNDIEQKISTYFIIHPESKFRRIWSIVDYFAMVINFFLCPLFICFPEYGGGLPYLSGICAGIFLLSMIFTFRTGVYRQFVLVMDRRIIAEDYIKGGKFLFDLLTMFPYVFVIDRWVKDEHYNMVWRGICFLNAIRALKIPFGPPSFWYPILIRKIRLSSKISVGVVGILKVWKFFVLMHSRFSFESKIVCRVHVCILVRYPSWKLEKTAGLTPKIKALVRMHKELCRRAGRKSAVLFCNRALQSLLLLQCSRNVGRRVSLHSYLCI